MQSSGRDKDNKDQDQYKNTVYRIKRDNREFLESLEAVSVKVRDEVDRVDKEVLLINPYPRLDNPRLIEPVRWEEYKDNYRIHVRVGKNEKYRYVYRVEGTTIHPLYVYPKGRDTYKRFRLK